MPETGQLTSSDVAIIVPVGGAAPAWERCAQSLARLDPSPGEIIIVIDGPSDDLASRAAEVDATVLVLDQRGGPARARNIGARETAREILLFIDSDIEVPTDLVARVAEVFSVGPRTDGRHRFLRRHPGRPGVPVAIPQSAAPLCPPERSRDGFHLLGGVRCDPPSSL